MSDPVLLEIWINSFKETESKENEEEIFLSLLLDLFEEITDYFIRLDAIKKFKENIPKKKKQVLRSKVTALGERTQREKRVQSKQKRKTDHRPSVNIKIKKSACSVSTYPSTASYSETDTFTCVICTDVSEWESMDIFVKAYRVINAIAGTAKNVLTLRGTKHSYFEKNSRWMCETCTGKPAAKG